MMGEWWQGKKGGKPDLSGWEIRSLLSQSSMIQEAKLFLSPLGSPSEAWFSAQEDKRFVSTEHWSVFNETFCIGI